MLEGYNGRLNRMLNSDNPEVKDMAHMVEMMLTERESVESRIDKLCELIELIPIRDRWSLEKEVAKIANTLTPRLKKSAAAKIFLRGLLSASAIWAILVIFIVKLLAGV